MGITLIFIFYIGLNSGYFVAQTYGLIVENSFSGDSDSAIKFLSGEIDLPTELSVN